MSDPAKELRTLAHQAIRGLAGRRHSLQRIRDTELLRNPPADFSLHMVTCHRDLTMALWCLKTFTLYCELSPAITIHDDGSLTGRDKSLLQDSLANCRVIKRADADRTMERALERHPLCRRMRQAPRFYCALKLFDPWVYATSDVVVLVDSDILFFRRPEELLGHAAAGTACFNSDYQSAYAVERAEIKRCLGIEVVEKFNAGLMVLSRRDYDLDLIERYFASFPSEIANLNRHEQTAYTILMSRCGARRLSGAYQISSQSIGPQTVSHHFVNDGSRLRFATAGVRELRRRGVLDQLKSR